MTPTDATRGVLDGAHFSGNVFITGGWDSVTNVYVDGDLLLDQRVLGAGVIQVTGTCVVLFRRDDKVSQCELKIQGGLYIWALDGQPIVLSQNKTGQTLQALHGAHVHVERGQAGATYCMPGSRLTGRIDLVPCIKTE